MEVDVTGSETCICDVETWSYATTMLVINIHTQDRLEIKMKVQQKPST